METTIILCFSGNVLMVINALSSCLQYEGNCCRRSNEVRAWRVVWWMTNTETCNDITAVNRYWDHPCWPIFHTLSWFILTLGPGYHSVDAHCLSIICSCCFPIDKLSMALARFQPIFICNCPRLIGLSNTIYFTNPLPPLSHALPLSSTSLSSSIPSITIIV